MFEKFKNFNISKEQYTKINDVQSIIIFLIIFAVLYSNFLFAYVPSASMYPTLAVKEFGIARKGNIENLEFQDIVLFHPEEGTKEIYVKRLIGLPGDTIEIKEGKLIRNGETVEEDYTLDDVMVGDVEEFTVPDNHYFMMGDNRNHSYDCRFIGSIPEDLMVGEMVFHMRVFPDKELEMIEYSKKVSAINEEMADFQWAEPTNK